MNTTNYCISFCYLPPDGIRFPLSIHSLLPVSYNLQLSSNPNALCWTVVRMHFSLHTHCDTGVVLHDTIPHLSLFLSTVCHKHHPAYRQYIQCGHQNLISIFLVLYICLFIPSPPPPLLLRILCWLSVMVEMMIVIEGIEYWCTCAIKFIFCFKLYTLKILASYLRLVARVVLGEIVQQQENFLFSSSNNKWMDGRQWPHLYNR